MNREYHAWWSPALGRRMELLVFGHGGARVLVFPTSRGRFYEWEDRGMFGPHGLGHHIAQGWLQVYCVDSVDAESWYNYAAHPGHRGWRQTQYLNYVAGEVLPFTQVKNGNPFLIVLLSITHKCLGDCRACRASIARLPRCQQGGEILAR